MKLNSKKLNSRQLAVIKTAIQFMLDFSTLDLTPAEQKELREIRNIVTEQEVLMEMEEEEERK